MCEFCPSYWRGIKFMRLGALLICFLASSIAWSQPNANWRQIGSFSLPPSSTSSFRITTLYFHDELHGVVALSRSGPEMDQTRAQIWRTTDGGKNWRQSLIPNYDTTKGHYFITSFDFANSTVGYLSLEDLTYPPFEGSGIWKTTDGGASWAELPGYPHQTQVVVAEGGKIATNYAGGLAFKTDGRFGLTSLAQPADWNRFFADPINSLYCKTTDAGTTWTPIQSQTVSNNLNEAWGIYYQRTANKFYICKEQGDNAGFVFSSSDDGVTWQRLGGLPSSTGSTFEVTGDIRGAGNALYVKGYDHTSGKYGFWRSLDEGRSWKHVGGVYSKYDTRFSVPPSCDGRIVVGFDRTSVWITTNGGDGELRRKYPIVEATNVPTLNACATPDSTKVIIRNPGCEPLVITSAALAGVTDGFALSELGLPLRLEAGEAIAFTISFDPWHRAGAHTVTLNAFGHYEIGTSTEPFDTTAIVAAFVTPVPPSILANSSSVDFASTSTCFTRDTVIELKNTGCDTLTLDQVIGSGAAYEFGTVATPLAIPPDSTVQVRITFRPQSTGLLHGNLQLTVAQQGITRSVDIPLSGLGAAPEGKLELMSASDIQLPDISICAQGDTSGVIRNNGCDTVIVQSVTVSSAGDYSLTEAISDVLLPSDSTLTFGVRFSPQQKGLRTATIAIVSTDENGSAFDEITLNIGAHVTEGKKTLAASLSTIDFGETNICEERDSIIHFTNSGCDTLIIDRVGTDSHFVLGELQLPIILAPGETVSVDVMTQVDTAGKPRQLTGSLSVSSNAENAVPPVELKRTLVYPTRLRIEAADEASGKVGEEIRFRIILEGDVPRTMTALHFDFLHNNDLLSYIELASSDLQLTGTAGEALQRQSFILSPVTAGTIGELTFRTFLAEAESTTLTFENIRFDAAGVTVAPECIAVIADSGSRFDYVYSCGDNMVKRYLVNDQILIRSFRPNPAQDEILLELDASVEEVVLYDARGTEALRATTPYLNTSSLPGGVYYLTARSRFGTQTRKINVIQ
jgi:hypothetical protein